MDNKAFIARLAKQMDCDTKTAGTYVRELVNIIGERVSDFDTVAIPGLGRFVPVKKPERINYDSSSGKRMLMPPKVVLEFIAASKITKGLSNE